MKLKHQWLFFVGFLLATSGLAVNYIFTNAPGWLHLPFQIVGLVMMVIYIIINGKMLKKKNSD
ncbi:MAG: hypothetical protein KBI01_05090 [Oscillospiraceae bacterium]|nr:hypothetical protein [Oscillospiraceae bacterium]